MDVDIGNALASVANAGVSKSSLDRLDDRVSRIHDRIEGHRERGTPGYAALNLPDSTDSGVIRRLAESFDDVETVITVGIGGSALGGATLVNGLETDREAIFLDTIDPSWIQSRLEDVDFDRSLVNVVSRSGRTVETLANFRIVRDLFQTNDVAWEDRTVITTGEDGPLREIADEHGLPVLEIPDGVPGRYSVLSSVGLFPAAACGVDIDAVLEGARAESQSLVGSLYECPAYAYGATAYALDQRGAGTNVFMPYAESLETLAEWFAQLWAESLGKDGVGQTPVRALGVTDQHSQLQLYRAGPDDKLVTFVMPQETDRFPIPSDGIDDLDHLDDTALEELQWAEFRATEASLARVNRPSIRIEIDRVDAFELGGLLYGLEAACILAGDLYQVDTFNQPAVEWAKRTTQEMLQERSDDNESVEDAETLPKKETLRISD